MSRNNGKRGTRQKSAVPCAIYTRKSVENGLDQEFNTLDAQREACEAYIASQKGNGWVCLPDRYDDKGYSGGNLDRPALQKLIADIKGGKIKVVVVYRIDRLSRSLRDFSQLMDFLKDHDAALVSVTESFDTSTPSGRVLLYIISIFSQYERELISERTSDKVCAARRRGKFTGGRPVLGYDVRDGKLVIIAEEAGQVREVFRLYLNKQSLMAVAEELNHRGWTTKTWASANGRTFGGKPFTKTSVHAIVSNPIYIGLVRFQGETFKGEHKGIVSKKTFDRAQHLLEENRQHGGARAKNRYGHLLRGLVRCTACNAAYSPSVSRKGNKAYRYYVCSGATLNGWKSCPQPSLNAEKLERAVVDQIRRIGEDPALIRETVRQVREAKRSKRPVLVGEQKRLKRELGKVRAEIKKWLDGFASGEVGGAEISNHVGLLEAKVRKLDGRLAEIAAELEALADATVNQADVAKALSLFDPVWDVLFPAEQERIIRLLIDRIEYDGRAGKMAIEFAPTGLRGLAGEIDDAREATA